jgi:hypothetical protein
VKPITGRPFRSSVWNAFGGCPGRSSTTTRKSQFARGVRSRHICSATGSTRRTTAMKFSAAFRLVIWFGTWVGAGTGAGPGNG